RGTVFECLQPQKNDLPILSAIHATGTMSVVLCEPSSIAIPISSPGASAARSIAFTKAWEANAGHHPPSSAAIAPAGASTGTHEAVELRDGGERFGGFGVDRAVKCKYFSSHGYCGRLLLGTSSLHSDPYQSLGPSSRSRQRRRPFL